MYNLRKNISLILRDKENKWFNIIGTFLIFLIAFNVIGVLAFSSSDFLHYELLKSHKDNFIVFYKFSIFLFTLEYFLRVWSVIETETEAFKPRIKGRLAYMCSHTALIDLVAILPFYIEMFISIDPDVHTVLRLAIIFKLVRFWPNMVNYFMVLLISSNVVAIVLESMDSLNMLYHNWFETFYVSSIAAFSVEYVLRVMIVGWEKPRHERTIIKDKIKYMLSSLAIIDLLAVLPFYINIFYYMEEPILLVLRLIVILKLTRYSSAMTLLMSVLRQELKTFTATLFIMLVVALFSASIIYLVESPYQPDKLGSIPEALYWTVITLTTIGYGDVAPVTPIGQFFTVFVAIAAIGITALPAGILASAISEYIRKTRKEYEKRVEKVLRDGKISDSERSELEKEGEALGLKGDDAESIINYASHLGRALNSCPHCGKPLSSNKRKIRTTTTKRASTRR